MAGGCQQTLTRANEMRQEPRNSQGRRVSWKWYKRMNVFHLVGLEAAVSVSDSGGPFTHMFEKSPKAVRKPKAAGPFHP